MHKLAVSSGPFFGELKAHTTGMNLQTRPKMDSNATPKSIHPLCTTRLLGHRYSRKESRNATTIKKIVVPTDLSERSFTALPLAVELAETFDAEIILVHVLGPDSADGSHVPSRGCPDSC